MADKKISDLPAAGAVADTDLYPTSQAGTTGKGTIAQLVTRLKVALLNIIPAWTGNPWRWNGAEIRHLFGETGLAADTGLWEQKFDGGVYSLSTRTDADTAGTLGFSIDRNGVNTVNYNFGGGGDGVSRYFFFNSAIGSAGGIVAANAFQPSEFVGRWGMASSVFREVDLVTEFTSRLHIDIAGKINVTTGMLPDGGGFKHGRVTTGSIAAGTTALVTLNWATAFADANYTPQASVLEATASSLSLSVVHIESYDANGVSVRIINNALGALTGTLLVTAIHD